MGIPWSGKKKTALEGDLTREQVRARIGYETIPDISFNALFPEYERAFGKGTPLTAPEPLYPAKEEKMPRIVAMEDALKEYIPNPHTFLSRLIPEKSLAHTFVAGRNDRTSHEKYGQKFALNVLACKNFLEHYQKFVEQEVRLTDGAILAREDLLRAREFDLAAYAFETFYQQHLVLLKDLFQTTGGNGQAAYTTVVDLACLFENMLYDARVIDDSEKGGFEIKDKKLDERIAKVFLEKGYPAWGSRYPDSDLSSMPEFIKPESMRERQRITNEVIHDYKKDELAPRIEEIKQQAYAVLAPIARIARWKQMAREQQEIMNRELPEELRIALLAGFSPGLSAQLAVDYQYALHTRTLAGYVRSTGIRPGMNPADVLPLCNPKDTRPQQVVDFITAQGITRHELAFMLSFAQSMSFYDTEPQQILTQEYAAFLADIVDKPWRAEYAAALSVPDVRPFLFNPENFALLRLCDTRMFNAIVNTKVLNALAPDGAPTSTLAELVNAYPESVGHLGTIATQNPAVFNSIVKQVNAGKAKTGDCARLVTLAAQNPELGKLAADALQHQQHGVFEFLGALRPEDFGDLAQIQAYVANFGAYERAATHIPHALSPELRAKLQQQKLEGVVSVMQAQEKGKAAGAIIALRAELDADAKDYARLEGLLTCDSQELRDSLQAISRTLGTLNDVEPGLTILSTYDEQVYVGAVRIVSTLPAYAARVLLASDLAERLGNVFQYSSGRNKVALATELAQITSNGANREQRRTAEENIRKLIASMEARASIDQKNVIATVAKDYFGKPLVDSINHAIDRGLDAERRELLVQFATHPAVKHYAANPQVYAHATARIIDGQTRLAALTLSQMSLGLEGDLLEGLLRDYRTDADLDAIPPQEMYALKAPKAAPQVAQPAATNGTVQLKDTFAEDMQKEGYSPEMVETIIAANRRFVGKYYIPRHFFKKNTTRRLGDGRLHGEFDNTFAWLVRQGVVEEHSSGVYSLTKDYNAIEPAALREKVRSICAR